MTKVAVGESVVGMLASCFAIVVLNYKKIQ